MKNYIYAFVLLALTLALGSFYWQSSKKNANIRVAARQLSTPTGVRFLPHPAPTDIQFFFPSEGNEYCDQPFEITSLAFFEEVYAQHTYIENLCDPWPIVPLNPQLFQVKYFGKKHGCQPNIGSEIRITLPRSFPDLLKADPRIVPAIYFYGPGDPCSPTMMSVDTFYDVEKNELTAKYPGYGMWGPIIDLKSEGELNVFVGTTAPEE